MSLKSLPSRLIAIVVNEGVGGLFTRVLHRFWPRKFETLRVVSGLVSGKTALEIGGPSQLFTGHGSLPIYGLLHRVDNVNFASETIWEGTIRTGDTFRFDPDRPAGHQIIGEGTDLSRIPSGSYDVVLSSHTIEHTANPIAALHEWRRVLDDTGLLVMVVPHKEGTFDHARPVTTLRHLQTDFETAMGEDDLTHLPEILELHDLAKDPGAGSRAEFEARSRKNRDNRALHHHVFRTSSVVALVEHAGFAPMTVEARWPYHIIVTATKAGSPHGRVLQDLGSDFKSDTM